MIFHATTWVHEAKFNFRKKKGKLNFASCTRVHVVVVVKYQSKTVPDFPFLIRLLKLKVGYLIWLIFFWYDDATTTIPMIRPTSPSPSSYLCPTFSFFLMLNLKVRFLRETTLCWSHLWYDAKIKSKCTLRVLAVFVVITDKNTQWRHNVL